MPKKYAIVFSFFDSREDAQKRAEELSEETGYEFEVVEYEEDN